MSKASRSQNVTLTKSEGVNSFLTKLGSIVCSAAMVVSLCPIATQAAYADTAADDEDPVVLTVYYSVNDGARQEAKAYTESAWHELVTEDMGAMGYLQAKTSTYSVVKSAKAYVTLDDLLADSDVSDYWTEGSLLQVYTGDYETYNKGGQWAEDNGLTYEKANWTYYAFPNTTSTTVDDTGATEIPVIFTSNYGSANLADYADAGAAAEAAYEGAYESAVPCIRVLLGVPYDDYADVANSKYTWGNRWPNNVSEVTVKYYTEWYDPAATNMTIYTSSQLAQLADIVNGTDATYAQDSFKGKTVTLANDLVLSGEWTAIGDATHAFEGTFEGAEHSISGLTITDATNGYKGLFGNNAGRIGNFTLNGSVAVSAGTDNVAAVCGYNSGMIESVVNNAPVTNTTSDIYAVGGICGQNCGTIVYCGNTAAITGPKAIGGIAGRSYSTGSASAIIYACYNSGAITGTGGSKDQIGGIAGGLGDKNNTGTTYGVIGCCYNAGAVTNPNGRWNAGIAGFATALTEISNCYNVGTIGDPYNGSGGLIAYFDTGAIASSVNNYALEQDGYTGTSYNGVTMAADEMKTADFVRTMGAMFNIDSDEINNGYPVLYWQGGTPALRVRVTCSAAAKGEKAEVKALANVEGTTTYRFYYSTDGTTWKQAAKNTTGLATVTANATNAARQWKVVATAADGQVAEASFSVTIKDPTVTAEVTPAKYGQKATVAVSTADFGVYGPAKYKYYYSADQGETWTQAAYHNRQYTETDSCLVTANGTNSKRMWKVVVTFKDGRTAEAPFTISYL